MKIHEKSLTKFDVSYVRVAREEAFQVSLIDVHDAAEHLGIAPKTLYKWVECGQIPFVRIGRMVRFRERDLERWVEERLENGNARRAESLLNFSRDKVR